MRFWPPFCGLMAFMAVMAGSAFGQVEDSTRSLPAPDSTIIAVPTDIQTADSGVREPVEFVAGDSLILSIKSGGQTGALYGNATVTMASSELSAYRINILFDIDELRAEGLVSDTGLVGKPTFQRDAELFVGESLSYNLRTERGRFVQAQTQFEDGFLRAEIVKAEDEGLLYVKNGFYTTCNCTDDPSYSLRSSKMKLVNKKWIYTGPLQLYLFNIPTPLWLPFGFLPATEGRRSGPLPPNYGEDEFGFYLRDWGWYFALSDYMDLQLQGGFWTKGSWETKSLFRYRKRYGFDGQLQVATARFKNGEQGDPDFSVRKTGSFRWSHNQTIGSTASFNANVNLTSSAYLRAVSQNYDDRTRQNIQSTLRYSKRWRSRSLSVQMSQNQILATDEVSLTIPSLSFSQSSFKPFAGGSPSPGRGERFYEKLMVSYNLSVNNRFSFRPLSDEELIARGDSSATEISWYNALFSADQFRRATGLDEQFDFKASHRIPLSAPFSVSRLPILGDVQLNLSPSFTYTEDWFIRSDRKALSADSTRIETTSVAGFVALRQFSTSLSASTIFYGIFPVRIGPYQTIRHTVRPRLSYSYRPDFFSDSWGKTRTYTNAAGEEVRYATVPGVGRGKQQQISFSLNNTFETKRVAADSTTAVRAASPRSVKLLDLTLSSNYNFAADSLNFGSILLNARTRILGKIDIDFRSSFSPYEIDENGRTVDDYAFSFGNPLGRLTRADLTIRTSLRSSTGDGSRPLSSPRAGFGNIQNDPFNPTASFFQSNLPVDYADFSIPWSLSFDLTYGITKSGVNTIRRAIMNTTFDFSLTPNWKVASRTGYDFENWEMVTTNLALARDFDCWQMSFNWVPFGAYQSWGFELHVKSGHLRDLLRLRQPKSDVRDRFGSFLR